MEHVEAELKGHTDSLDQASPDLERRPIAEPLFSKFDSFEEANLDPRLADAISAVGWTKPTPVQSLCLPYTLQGRDVAGFAQTGTGKTGVFLTTIAQRLLSAGPRANSVNDVCQPFAVILAPTRELAMQIDSDAEQILGKIGLKSLAVFGGVDYEKQASALKDGVDVIVATPGRLKDFFQKKLIALSDTGVFVCDEADRMFDMGFIDDVEFFLSKLGPKTQRLLFSATTNDQVKELAFEYLETPEYISVNPEVMTPENIEQHLVIAEAKDKLQIMLGLLHEHSPNRAIVFTNTKLVADWLHFKLAGNGFAADVLTGDLQQSKRIQLIQKIKAGELKYLIATDVASRGLHISGVTHVYNFDLPDEPANYIHRIGRTARAGAKGLAYSLVCEDYGMNLPGIVDLVGTNVELKSEWYPESYLLEVDKAGNPYDDSAFRNSGSMARFERERERGRERNDRERQERPVRQPQSPERPRPERNNNQGQQHERPKAGGRPKQHPRESREPRQATNTYNQQHPGTRPQSQRAQALEPRRSAKRELINRTEGRRPAGGRQDALRQQPQSNLAKAPAQKSLFAMIKHFFAVIFGRKPKL